MTKIKKIIYQVLVVSILVLVGSPLYTIGYAVGAPKKAVWIFNIGNRPAQVQILQGQNTKLMDATLNPVGNENIIHIKNTNPNIKRIVLRIERTYLIKTRYEGDIQWIQRTLRLTRSTISYIFVLP